MSGSETPADDLRLLDETVRRFAGRHAAPAGLPVPAPDLWPELVASGLVGLALDEERGGTGFGAGGALVAGRALGARAVPVCFPLSAVLVPALLDGLGLTRLRDKVLAGETRVAVSGALLPSLPGAEAASLAFGPMAPDLVLCPGPRPDEITLAPAAAAVRGHAQMADGRPLLRIGAADGEVVTRAQAAMARALPVGLVAAAAEALGAMEALLEQTLEHLRTRRQFGQPLGSFQVLQFRMVDASTAVEEARALGTAAARAIDVTQADAAALAHAAWTRALWSGRTVAEAAIQMHGAIGMTADCGISLLVRRLLINEHLFGPAELHMARYRALAA